MFISTLTAFPARSRPSNPTTHASPHLSIAYLIHDVRDWFKPVHAQRIGNHINRIITLLPLPSGRRQFKACALGSTRALLHSVSVDDVESHGAWSSRREKNCKSLLMLNIVLLQLLLRTLVFQSRWSVHGSPCSMH
jgi:hypothetical protein